jgi:DNA (cytosine-5)-methyltransferase 1
MRKCFSQSLNNLKEERLPVVVDLFSGCGGLALGFHSVGFNIAYGIDIDENAALTASVNFHWQNGSEISLHNQGDVSKFDINPILPLGQKSGFIVIGGPPCQAYSQAGRGKLRSLGENRVHTNDARGYLYKDLINKAVELNARCIIVENVPESVNFGPLNIPDEICRELTNFGYKANWSILNAADYGVPQIRERVFVIAWKSDEEIEPEFPIPTHNLNGQFFQSRQKNKRLQESQYYVSPPRHPDNARHWLTVRDAISDLPTLFKTADSKYKLYDNDEILLYGSEPQNEYQRLMRNWPNFKNYSFVTGHGFRKTKRDFPIFEKMNPGDNYLNASIIADNIFAEALRFEGITKESNCDRYIYLKRKYVPPYDRNKFFDKWRRLDSDRPAHTLVAHLSIDTYSHIHPWEPRGISIREAARLQSFPDSFIFPGSMGDAFRQIGNAVPPLLSQAIAGQVLKQLCEKEEKQNGIIIRDKVEIC